MADYDKIVSRATGTDPIAPPEFSNQIIQELPTQCVSLAKFKHVTMSTKTKTQPVLDLLPVAYWTSGDTGLSKTTYQEWKGVDLVAETLSTIVPIPRAYLDDADIPLWDEIRPRVVEAVGKLIDQATFFGVGAPATFADSLYEGAAANGNTTEESSDLTLDVAKMGQKLATVGYKLDSFVFAPGFDWRLAQLRDNTGQPIYQADLQGNVGGKLYGRSASEVDNGSWDASKATLIGGDFSKAMLGIRRDLDFAMFNQSVISDDEGKIVLNLMQQDAVALRVTMRVAFATAKPVTALDGTTTRYPFVALVPGESS